LIILGTFDLEGTIANQVPIKGVGYFSLVPESPGLYPGKYLTDYPVEFDTVAGYVVLHEIFPKFCFSCVGGTEQTIIAEFPSLIPPELDEDVAKEVLNVLGSSIRDLLNPAVKDSIQATLPTSLQESFNVSEILTIILSLSLKSSFH